MSVVDTIKGLMDAGLKAKLEEGLDALLGPEEKPAPPLPRAPALSPEDRERYRAIAAKIWKRENENQDLVQRALDADKRGDTKKRDYWLAKARKTNTKSGRTALFRGTTRRIEGEIARALATKKTSAASEKGSVVAPFNPGRPKDPQANTPVEAVRDGQQKISETELKRLIPECLCGHFESCERCTPWAFHAMHWPWKEST